MLDIITIVSNLKWRCFSNFWYSELCCNKLYNVSQIYGQIGIRLYYFQNCLLRTLERRPFGKLSTTLQLSFTMRYHKCSAFKLVLGEASPPATLWCVKIYLETCSVWKWRSKCLKQALLICVIMANYSKISLKFHYCILWKKLPKKQLIFYQRSKGHM